MHENFLKVLVCPLDWGIGHATRCVPVIRQLLKNQHSVTLAADGRSYDFLHDYFPELELIRFPGMKISYPRKRSMALKMFLKSPALITSIYDEHNLLKEIIREKHIDVVISDNRFGLWSKEAYSVYMTHQVMIKAPRKLMWLEPLLHRFHGWFIKKYDECWVPDLPGEINLSGGLGHKYPLPRNGHFIGLLSRFSGDGADVGRISTGPDVLILLSGPEPQRTILENLILEEIQRIKAGDVIILRGMPGETGESPSLPGVRMINHLPDPELTTMIRGANIIICRPGYSTLMDLAALGRTAVLIPTPGQTEQEYLATFLSAGGSFAAMDQAGFNLEKALQAGRQLPARFDFDANKSLLEERISGLLHRAGKY